ncbi:MAG: arabinogalactan endo-1,4-beta-galactosidase [Balneola sp.]|nr:MAG: arabinogalactan endo-1,4-beta-galactosidase [Balneola sp.]
MKTGKTIYVLIIIIAIGCSEINEKSSPSKSSKLYLGADLSYVNEMEDCGGSYRANGELVDPFEFFKSQGSNIVRVRLWHTPNWTGYSDYDDVVKTISRVKNAGMETLLDFHYSDTWADPGDQIIPAAWKGLNDEILADSLYQYTYKTLISLNAKGLLPEFVQIGNETNSEILLEEHVDELTEPINWSRNILLFNAGLKAVEDVEKELAQKIESMLHIAQPEFAFPWFSQAIRSGLSDFDWIGLSYYPLWSKYQIPEAATAIDSIIQTFNKPLMVIETAYPYTIEEFDDANNILWHSAVLDGYPATPQGQLKYMQDLTQQVISGGGSGVIYWEPAWISTECKTLWGTGSHWENATFFDAANNNEALITFEFFDQSKYASQ